ncbi:MAG: hypothetical protein RJB38_2453 [Pseudomonadota bacterium]|jgi:hypothetical protein
MRNFVRFALFTVAIVSALAAVFQSGIKVPTFNSPVMTLAGGGDPAP